MANKIETRNEKLKNFTLKDLKTFREYHRYCFVGRFFSTHFAPPFTLYFLKHNINANTVTIFMIFFGILGSVLFALPYFWTKIAGFICFHLWFIMDCSDGDVARASKSFSSYGKEMDAMAHLICHPLMNLSLFITYLQMQKYNELLLAFIFIIFISIELVQRSYCLFSSYLCDDPSGVNPEAKFNLFKYIGNEINNYPNFILIFPILTILDYRCNISSLYLLILLLSCIFIKFSRDSLIRLLYFYKSTDQGH